MKPPHDQRTHDAHRRPPHYSAEECGAWRVAFRAQPTRTRASAPHCPRCDYNLHGLDILRCPECGFVIEDNRAYGAGLLLSDRNRAALAVMRRERTYIWCGRGALALGTFVLWRADALWFAWVLAFTAIRAVLVFLCQPGRLVGSPYPYLNDASWPYWSLGLALCYLAACFMIATDRLDPLFAWLFG